MRRLMIMALATVAPVQAMAADCPAGSSPTAISIQDWSVTISDQSGMKAANVSLTLRNGLPKAFRLIDASVSFSDVLGERISSVSLDRDAKVANGATFEDKGDYLGTQLNRIPEMNRADVVVVACTRAVVYSDGSKETFE